MIRLKNKNKGFTIVELMIATAVFSTVLLLATTGVINIGRLYYKGITTARTQETARSITDEVSRSIQLTDGEMKSGSDSEYQSICIGKDRYTYIIDRKVKEGVGQGLWVDEITEGDPCEPYNFSNPAADGNDGKELLSTNMRLLDFVVEDDNDDRTKVDVGASVAYGDSDLLTHCPPNDSENPGPCPGDPTTAECRSITFGATFCAISSLETFVKRRFPIVYLN
jgi:prepilin-type N-terminal cleavage/methylation domain-containing protein